MDKKGEIEEGMGDLKYRQSPLQETLLILNISGYFLKSTDKSLQIFLQRKSESSVCLGTDEVLLSLGLK